MTSKIVRNYFPEILALGIRRRRPSMVTVNLTRHCNQRCVYCEIGQGIAVPQRYSLQKEDIFWILDEMKKLKIPKISLCGGEPLLFPGLMEVISYGSGNGTRCSITSNGMTVFGLEQEYLLLMKQSGVELNISIDSLDEEVSTLTRGVPSALGNALKSVEVLHKSGIPVTILCVISRYNFRQISGFVKELQQLGVRQVLFQPVIYQSNYPGSETIHEKVELNVEPFDIPELESQLKEILRFEHKNRIRTNAYRILPWISSYLHTAAGKGNKWFFRDVLNKFYCRELDAIIDISFEGGIQPCGLAEAEIFIHQGREQGLLALWQKATGKLRDDLSQGHYHACCNACCNHFSRNMLASMMRYPWQNRNALSELVFLLGERTFYNMVKW